MKEQTMKNIAAVGIATLAVGATSTQAKAEELQPAQVSSVPTTEASVQGQVVTQDQVNTAKANLDTETTQVEQAQADVNQAQSVVDNTQNETNQAQNALVEAQIAVEKATPEAIAVQENEVAQAENLVSVAESAVAPAQEEVVKAQEKATAQETVVKQEEGKVAVAQADVVSAQQVVNQAQSNLDGTGQAQVVAEKEAAATAKQEAETRVAQTEAKLEQAKVADANRQGELDKGEAKAAETSRALTTATTKLEEAKTSAQQAQATEDAKLVELNALKSEVANENIIPIPAGYVETLKAYIANPSQELSDELLKLGREAYAYYGITEDVSDGKVVKLGEFSDYDKSREVNPTNLTFDQRLELAQYYVKLTNPIRKAFGVKELVVSSDVMEAAQYVSERTTKFGHDKPLKDTYAKSKYGYRAIGENMSYHAQDYTAERYTMSTLKGDILENSMSFLFRDWRSNWGHAKLMTSPDLSYFGFATNSVRDISTMDYALRYNFVSEEAHQNYKGGTITKYPASSTEDKAAQLQTVQAVYTAAVVANVKAKSALDDAKNIYNVADNANNQAQTELAQLKSADLLTPAAQAEYDAAKVALNQVTERVAKAEKALANLTADVKTKQEALATAKANLKEKEVALAAAQAKRDAEKAELAKLVDDVAQAEQGLKAAQNGVVKAKANLQSAKSELDKLKNAEKNLQVAKEKLGAKMDALSVAKATLGDKIIILNDLLAKKEITKKEYDTLMAQYTLQLEAERLAKLEEKRVALEKQGEVPVAVKDDKGVVVDYTTKKELDAKKVSIQGKKSIVMSKTGLTYAQTNPADYKVLVAKVDKAMTGSSVKSETKQTAGATLPATGSTDSPALIALGAGLTSLGLAGARRRKS